jgi:hypothetical protein
MGNARAACALIERDINAIWDTVNSRPTRVVEISTKGDAGASGDKCPTCGEAVPKGAKECPSCGESLAKGAVEEVEEEEGEKKLNKLFYIGLILILLGGPGIAVGSWIHDLLKINFPPGYDAWSVFGWVNKMASAVGIVMLLVGMLVLAYSILKQEPADEEEETEESA